MVSSQTYFPVVFKRLQFPILGAYYLSFNRAQGQSLARGGMYLPRNVFTHGHCHVGYGRLGDPDCMFVYTNQKELEHFQHLLDPEKHYMKNIVYQEIFSSVN